MAALHAEFALGFTGIRRDHALDEQPAPGHSVQLEGVGVWRITSLQAHGSFTLLIS